MDNAIEYLYSGQSFQVIWRKSGTKRHRTKWQHSKECMCCLQNTAMRDYQESVTIGQTDRRTDRRQTKGSLCAAMLRRQHKNDTFLKLS